MHAQILPALLDTTAVCGSPDIQEAPGRHVSSYGQPTAHRGLRMQAGGIVVGPTPHSHTAVDTQ